MTDEPIACSLGANDLEQRLTDWRTLFAGVQPVLNRVAPTTLAVAVDASNEQLATLTALTRAEAACCPFFHFAIEIDAQSTTFVVTVPPDAAPVLDDFAQLLALGA